MNNLLLKEYLGKELVFTPDGWINAIQVTRAFGKKGLENFMRSKGFDEYKKAICKIYRTEEKDLIRVAQGGVPNQQGTFLHPKLVVVFARWISAEFAVKCDEIIYSILTGKLQLRYKNLQQAYETLEDKAFDRYELIKLFIRP